MQERIESIGEFVVSRGEAAELLETVEKSLDEVARLVAMPVDVPRGQAIPTRGNHRLSAAVLNGLYQGIAVVAFVGDHCLRRNSVNQCPGLRDVRHLPAGEDQAQWVAQRIDASMDFGRQPTARATDRLTASIFCAPVACW